MTRGHLDGRGRVCWDPVQEEGTVVVVVSTVSWSRVFRVGFGDYGEPRGVGYLRWTEEPGEVTGLWGVGPEVVPG